MLAIAGDYGLPVIVTENGIADSDDDQRAAYLTSHLEAIRAAMRGEGGRRARLLPLVAGRQLRVGGRLHASASACSPMTRRRWRAPRAPARSCTRGSRARANCPRPLAGLASRSLSSRRRILPEGDLGISSTTSTRRIRFWGATCSLTQAISSVGVEIVRGRHDEGLGQLARLLVGDADHGDVADVLVPEDQGLELGGRDLEALVLDQLLEAVDDLEVAVGVDDGDVAGVQPAVLVDGRGCRLGVVRGSPSSPGGRASRARRARPPPSRPRRSRDRRFGTRSREPAARSSRPARRRARTGSRG